MEKKIWHQHYPKSIETTINPDQYTSLLPFLENKLKEFKNLPGYENMGKILTFQEIDNLSTYFAAYLQTELKLQKGDRFAIQMPNILQYPIAIFGSIKAGLVLVNINPLYTTKEMLHQINDSGAKAILILSNFADKLEKIKNKTCLEHVIITHIGDMLGGTKGLLTNIVVKHVKKMVPQYNLPEAFSFKMTLKLGANYKYYRPEIKNEDVALLQYTGGTTGVSKGAVLTHRNLLSNMMQIGEWMKPKLLPGKELMITALPLYHIFALTVNCFSMLSIGAKNVLITNPRDLNSFCKELKKHKFTVITGVNTLFNGLLNDNEFRKLNFSNLKVTVAGGMALQSSIAEKWEQLTKVRIAEGYGLTETSPVASCNLIEGSARIGTIGIPVCNTEIKLVDEYGKEVQQGERGEIWIKGPQVMKGYWNRQDETDKVFEGEWFKSGDVGVMLEDGYFKIVDRIKEMILVSGFNVYPNEVEDAIALHPKVSEVGVIGVPHPKSNETVKAFIVKKDNSLTEEEIIEHCKLHLTSYKVPREIEFRIELPKSPIGKILRRLLKDEI